MDRRFRLGLFALMAVAERHFDLRASAGHHRPAGCGHCQRTRMKKIIGTDFLLTVILSLLALGSEVSAQSTLQINCPPNRTNWVCESNSAVVTFLSPTTTSSCPTNATVICTPASGSVFPLGVTTVNCRATNSCRQSASCSFTVTVARDVTPPALSCPTNVSVFTANRAGRPVYYGPLVFTDDPEASVSCAPPSGSVFPVGVTPVVCTARDACGNQAVCNFTVEVTLLKLFVSQGASGLVLSWTGDAILETSDEVSGPWLPIRSAGSPYPVAFVGVKKFFRLSAPGGDVDCGEEIAVSPSEWIINVPSARIQGAFLLRGQPFPNSFLHGANFFLRNASSGDEVYLGLSNNQGFDRRVVPGNYDVIYEHKIGNQVPLNTVAIIQTNLAISGDMIFNIDVPAVSIDGAFSFAGTPAPGSALENGRVKVRAKQNGALTDLAETRDQIYSALLIPGAYDLMYSGLTGGEVAPANDLTAFLRDVAIVAPGVMNIDVPTIEVSGNFLYNGVLAPDSQTESGQISLIDPDTDSAILLGETRFQLYRRLIIPGTYDLHYERLTGSSIAPANRSARFVTGVVLNQTATNNINVPAVQISGDFLVNGAPTPGNATESGQIRLRNGDDVVFLGATDFGQFQVLVIPGSYYISYEGLTGGAIMPANTNATVGTVVIAGTTNFDINIPVVTFAADLRFNGGNFPGPVGDEAARLTLESSDTPDVILLGYFPAQNIAQRLVVPGTYRVRYEYESGVQLPRNTFAVLGEELEISQNLQTSINIRAANLTGSFTLNGGAFPAGPGQNAAMTLRSLSGEDSLFLGGTSGGGYSTVIIPGRYTAYYNWAVGDLIPRNQNARLPCPR
ncbi:MAG: HYR domain-containing protein [Verrucomicrobiota bacterium]